MPCLKREGSTLATYGLASGPQGYRPLRDFLAAKLKRDAGMDCVADDILIVSGSLQALDLVNESLLARGDTVIIERETYQGSLNRLTRLGVNTVGIPLDHEGMRMDALAAALADLKQRGIMPKYIYTIPTVQNPTGTIMPEARRAELAETVAAAWRADLRGRLLCRPDLGRPASARDPRDGARPAASSISARSPSRSRRRCGSASSSRRGRCCRGCWRSRPTRGSGALEQMVLAEYCAPHFSTHVPKLTRGLRAKLDTLMEALNEQFGTAAEFDDPKGGIFLWVKLPDHVDTLKLYQAALAAGVAINPGPEWCTDKAYAGSRLRLCFASPSHQEIREGVAVLAEVCRQRIRRAGAQRQCREARPKVDHHRGPQPERLFRILLDAGGNAAFDATLIPRPTEENEMKKLAYVIAALATIAVAAPSIASAETVVVRRMTGVHHGWRHRRGPARGHFFAHQRSRMTTIFVMAGPVPAIHVFDAVRLSRRGCPRQARA